MKECFKRIILDIKDIQKDPIESVYYFPDEDNILYGNILIIGPKDTPYQYGNYMFQLSFTEKYPYEPPVVKYVTNDGTTRFNPNFYRNGKVCLSILNTWSGEKWSACQSLRSVLITLQTTMNELPLLNEPGVNKDYHMGSIKRYNHIISYKNFSFAILYYIQNPDIIPLRDERVIEKIFENYHKNKEEIVRCLENINNDTEFPCKGSLGISLYNMSNVSFDFRQLLDNLI